MIGLIFVLIIGLVAAGLANLFTRGGTLRAALNLAVGMAGSVAGAFLFMHFGEKLFGPHNVGLFPFGGAFVTALAFVWVAERIKR